MEIWFLANISRKYTKCKTLGIAFTEFVQMTPKLNTKYDFSHQVLWRMKMCCKNNNIISQIWNSKRFRQNSVDKISYFSRGQIHPSSVKSLPCRNAWPGVIISTLWTPGQWARIILTQWLFGISHQYFTYVSLWHTLWLTLTKLL